MRRSGHAEDLSPLQRAAGRCKAAGMGLAVSPGSSARNGSPPQYAAPAAPRYRGQ